MDTIGGYLVTRAGRLPMRGEMIPGPGLFEFEVLDADPRRIKRVRITRLKERRERPRTERHRGEPDVALAGTTPPAFPGDDAPRRRMAPSRHFHWRPPPVTLARLAHAVVLAYGWRRAGIALAAGAVSVLAMAPINAWPVLFVTFPVLVWLVDGSTAGRWSGATTAAGAGWCFGFGYFTAGLYWIGYAFLVDAKTFGWLLPVAVAGLPAYLALYTALALAAARLIWVRGPERILALAAAMTIAEWLRGHLLSGFPWNTFGYALTQPLVLAQSVSLVGIWSSDLSCSRDLCHTSGARGRPTDTRHP